MSPQYHFDLFVVVAFRVVLLPRDLGTVRGVGITIIIIAVAVD